MSDLRLGFVGAGRHSETLLDSVRQAGGARVVAVFDLDRARAEAFDADAAVEPGWEELLARDDLDAVVVCTPPLAHRDPAIAALERGLPLYLEKPVARNLVEAREIAAAAERTGTVCALGYQWRGAEPLDRLREELHGQTLGLLTGTQVGAVSARPWFLDPATGGGQVLERASHTIDLQRAVAGDVVRVQATGARLELGGQPPDGQIDDVLAITLRFASGAVGAIRVAWPAPGLPSRFALEVLASDAALTLELDPVWRLRGVSRGAAVEASSGQEARVRTMARFLECARTGDAAGVFCDAAEATATLAASLAVEQALATGETVEMPA
jgi:predicted dehydrogenase